MNKTLFKSIASVLLGLLCVQSAGAQRVLTLDSCRAMALRNNKQINASRLTKDVAYNARKATRTQYLPKIDALGGYEYTSREISLLSDDQKSRLSNMGTNLQSKVSGDLSQSVGQQLSSLVQQGAITSTQAQQLSALMSQMGSGQLAQYFAGLGNALGQEVVDAFKTDTKSIWAGAVLLRQPVYMGGAIIAANKMADINERLADDKLDLQTQSTLYNIDQTYWTVVSLKQKYNLAQSYRDLVKKLDDDVYKMIKQGVATRSDGLKVDVKVNEADMQITQVEDGLTLSKMLLCQLCGLPMDSQITLADEDRKTLSTDAVATTTFQPDSSLSSRPEIRMLQNTVDLSEQGTKLTRAQYLPHVMLVGGYSITNPNLYNGFHRNFSGAWSVGVSVQVPVWNWFESRYKIRASKTSTAIARMELADTQEKVNLQITQGRFKVKEAQKRLIMANNNIKSAEENLRCAQVGFREGVMETTDVLEAQTAWQQAQSQKIDAEVEVKMANVNLEKALGVLSAASR
jgi:outer membrane protein TolC